MTSLTSRRTHVVGWTLLTFAVGLLYFPVFHAQFVYDDQWLIVHNQAIRSLQPFLFFRNPQTVASALSGLSTDIYRPLTVLAFSIDYQLWGLWPLPYHVENVLLHLLVGLGVWTFLGHLLRNKTAAFWGTAVFLLHPVQVQTVAWVAQRSNLLCAVAVLLSLACFLRDSSRRTIYTVCGVFLYIIALLCKETAIVLPGLLVWVDLQRKNKFRDRATAVQYGALMVISGLYLIVRHQLLHQWTQFTDAPAVGWSDAALGTMAFPVYLGKLLCPVFLRPSYDYPLLRLPRLAGALLVCVIFLALWAYSLRKKPVLALGLGWILTALAPVLQIFPIRAFVAERFLYLPVMGLAIVAGWVYAEFKPVRRALVAWVGGLAIITALTVPAWKNDQTLWAYAVRQEPANAFAHLNYADHAPTEDVAEAEYKVALISRPTPDVRFTATNNLAWLYIHKNQHEKALLWSKLAVQQQPRQPQALYNLMKSYEGVHDGAHARAIQKQLQHLQ